MGSRMPPAGSATGPMSSEGNLSHMSNICPKCTAERVRRSHRRGAAEHFLSVWGFQSRRCHGCNTRFVALGDWILFRRDLDRLTRKLSVVALATLALLTVVALVLLLSPKEPTTANTASATNGLAATRVVFS